MPSSHPHTEEREVDFPVKPHIIRPSRFTLESRRSDGGRQKLTACRCARSNLLLPFFASIGSRILCSFADLHSFEVPRYRSHQPLMIIPVRCFSCNRVIGDSW